MSVKQYSKIVVVMLIIALVSLNTGFAASTSPLFTQFYMKEMIKDKKQIAYLTIEANLPAKTLTTINKTLFTFFSTAHLEMTHVSTANLIAYADHHKIGNLGVFSSGGTTYMVDTEKTEWKKTLHLNLTNNHTYVLKDLFKSTTDYKKAIVALLIAKNESDPTNQMPIDGPAMVTDTTFEILPEGIRFFQMVRLGHVSHPYQYFSLVIPWYELDGLVNKEGELWGVIKGAIDISPLHPVQLETDGLWGYANVKNELVIEPQYLSASKFDQWGFARVSTEDSPQVTVLIDQRNKHITGFSRLENIVSATTAVMYTMEDIVPRLVTLDTQKELYRGIYSAFSEGVAAYSLDKKVNNRCGYVNSKGQVTISARYLEAYPFFNGKALVKLESGKYAQINYAGKVMVNYKVNIMPTPTYNNVLIYKSNGKYGAISGSNKAILPAIHKELSYVSENGQFIITTSKGVYLADITGKRMTDYYQGISHDGGNQYSATTLTGLEMKIKGNGQHDGAQERAQVQAGVSK